MQVYYDLIKGRKEKGMEGQIAIVRIEQLAPFPFDLVMRELRRYPKAEVMWCAFPARPSKPAAASAASAASDEPRAEAPGVCDASGCMQAHLWPCPGIA